MKSLFYIFVVLTLVSGCAQPLKENFVFYKSSEFTSCDLVIGLSEQDNKLLYKVTTNARSATGNFIKEGQQIVFSGLFASESIGNKKIEISAMLKDDTLLIQNYGNRMNPYTLFSECESKYLSLKKERT